MANRRRGEVAVEIGGRCYTLCLTLGALAELEDAFDAPDLPALGERLAGGRLRGRDVLILLGIGLRGGGQALTDKEVAALPLASGLDPVLQALGDMLEAAFGDPSPNPPPPQGT
jgi:hypothetical protein